MHACVPHDPWNIVNVTQNKRALKLHQNTISHFPLAKTEILTIYSEAMRRQESSCMQVDGLHIDANLKELAISHKP